MILIGKWRIFYNKRKREKKGEKSFKSLSCTGLHIVVSRQKTKSTLKYIIIANISFFKNTSEKSKL